MKQTEIGLIPDDWEVKSLGEVATIVGGGTPSTLNSAYWNGDIQWFTPAELSDSKKYVSKSERTITERGLKESSAKLLPKGTVLLTTRASIGITAILENPASTNQGFQSLIAKNNCCSEFLYYVIPLIKDEMLSRASGSTFAEISAKKLSTITFQLPPLPEQQRIAKALSDVDALISTTEKLIQKKKNIKQGTMQNLLTSKKRLPGFAKSTNYKQSELGLIPEDWEVKSLGDIFSIKHGYGFEGQFFSSENNQHIVVTPGNFKLEGGFQKQKQPIYYTGTYPDEFKLKPNDLIIMMTDLSKNSDTLGNPAIVPDDGNDYLHNQRIGLIQIHNDSFVKDYIYLLLCTKEYHEAVVATAAGSTVKHTSPKRIYSINLIVSTSKEEQSAIANVLSSMDKEIETLNTKLEKYRNLKTAMMQQLLTGKIRLVK